MRFPLLAGLMSTILLKPALQAGVLTPEKLLTSPRSGSGIANPAGTRALVGCRTFSFEEDSFNEVLLLVKLPTSAKDIIEISPESTQLESISRKVSSGFWLSDDVAAFVDSADNKVYAKDISTDSIDDYDEGWTAIGDFGAPINDIKAARSSNGVATHLVFSAQVYGDGDLEAVKKHDESEAVKEWDRVKGEYRLWV